MTWKGTYCSGITGEIVHQQPGTFTEYITGLGEWEQGLINEMEILTSLDVLIAFLKEGNFLITTDGSAEDSIMLFSWKTCDQEGKMYICHTGLAFEKESSFCVKAYGVLSVVCTIQRLIEFYMLNESAYLKIYLDNEGAIQRINRQSEYPYDCSLHTINPDWGIIAQICDILKDKRSRPILNTSRSIKMMTRHIRS
eukprot:4573325-Ditylum_brightwellii.AAC.1